MQPFGNPVLPDVNWMLISVSAVGAGTFGAVAGASSTMCCQFNGRCAFGAPCITRLSAGASEPQFSIASNTDRHDSSITRYVESLSFNTYSSSRLVYCM